ncbi:MAG: hypothetical protein HUU16_15985, partial [Candidatus Omnitrophica bacterium]|nr:hypothetical protein [Candidatus Omnitrophota bacterium]
MKKSVACLARFGIAMGCLGIVAGGSGAAIRYEVESVTRFIEISYTVPSDAGEEVEVLCSWSPAGKGNWRPAKVHPLVSETALYLVREPEWREWTEQGKVLERRAAGLERTVVFNPYPEAQIEGKVEVDFRVEIQSPEGRVLSSEQAPVQADNSDVVCLEDWSKVFQQGVPSKSLNPDPGEWAYRTNLAASEQVTRGDDLLGKADIKVPLPQLSHPLNLKGWYAIHVCTSPLKGGIGLRLSGDERTDYVGSRYPFQEVFWNWRRMDHQHLVLRQQHIYTGWAPAHVDYVRLVPLGEDQVESLEAKFGGKVDKFIAGYYEPYSWAFYENVQHTLQHREPLTAFREARLSLVDIQIGRFGDKVVYESRLTDPLNYSTIGDPIGEVRVPTTDNVGRMQQFSNALDATLRYARELGLIPHANFGASNCYPGTPLQSDFSKQHPEWMRGACLRFEVPQVREYALSLYREALEIGAPGISIDFCRYPESIDNATT